MNDTRNSRFPKHLQRNHLPEPEWSFPNARIGTYATDSKPDFPPARQAAMKSRMRPSRAT